MEYLLAQMEVMKTSSFVPTGIARKDTPSVRTTFSVFLGDHGVLSIQGMHFVTRDHGDFIGVSQAT